MPFYRKRPVVIEADEFWPDIKPHPQVYSSALSSTGWAIITLESGTVAHEVTPGDYIIKGVAGEFYACKPVIFHATYEPVDDQFSTEMANRL